MLKIGVLGAGHLGKIHLRLLKELPEYELAGFYDIDPAKAAATSKELNVHAFNSMEELVSRVDAVDIVTPTIAHLECGVYVLKNSKHVFIEKPLCNTLEEAKELLALAAEANVKVQVGHVERFNPAFMAARPYIKNPMFIETHRLAQFNPRGTDVPVVMDLMIHDIDIVLSLVKTSVRKISTSGVAVVSDTPDIANARIEFDNGCVANLTASRISLKNMRKSRFFQKDAYISVDFLEKKTEVVRLHTLVGDADPLALTIDLGEGKGTKVINFEEPKVAEINAIKYELQLFAKAINNNTATPVTIRDGYEALLVATQIMDKLRKTPSLVL